MTAALRTEVYKQMQQHDGRGYTRGAEYIEYPLLAGTGWPDDEDGIVFPLETAAALRLLPFPTSPGG